MIGKTAILKMLGPYEQLLLDLFPRKEAIVAINVESGRFVSILDTDDIEKIEKAIKQLSSQREKVVRMLFGIGQKQKTVKETAEILQLDESTIHSTKEAAIGRIRRDNRKLEEQAISCMTQDGLARQLGNLKRENTFLKKALAELVDEKTQPQL